MIAPNPVPEDSSADNESQSQPEPSGKLSVHEQVNPPKRRDANLIEAAALAYKRSMVVGWIVVTIIYIGLYTYSRTN